MNQNNLQSENTTEKTRLEQSKLAQALEYRKQMLNALNEMAVTIISHKKETFNNVMSDALKSVALVAGIDRIAVYRRLGRETQLGQIYLWFGKTIPLEKELIELPEIPPIFRWLDVLRAGNCISGNVEEMVNDEAVFLRLFGVKSIFFVPIFVKEDFWGVITLEDHTNYRKFEEDNLDLLRSAAHLCAGAVVRFEIEREVESANAKLKDALEQATAASRAKSDFLSGMSHEMRTPLNAIIGMTTIGKNSNDMEQKNYALNKILDASSHLLGLINAVLDMAKIEADKLELAPVEYSFERMVQKVLTMINFQVDEKNQRLIVHIDENIPRVVIGDDHRLAQVLANLLSNAVKFSPKEGEIRLNIFLNNEIESSRAADELFAYNICELRIEVSDNGIGISEEQQKRLFRPFEQADSGISRKYGGTGLGLIISKRIVEMMGGDIKIESKLGQGARFIFTVKLQRSEKSLQSLLSSGINPEAEDEKLLENKFQTKRMLLAEDIAINREIIISILEDTGILIDCAENGKEALDMIEAAPDKYDIVFMDMQMPLMDGLEATRRIRAAEASRAIDLAFDLQYGENEFRRLPIIALTANVFKSDIDECIAAGMDDHLGKPLDLESVYEKLRKYLN